MLCRREHYFIDDRSVVLSTGAWLCRREHGFVDRSMVFSTGAMFCRRQEHCFVDRSTPGGRPMLLSTRALLSRRKHAWRLSQQLGWPAHKLPGRSGRLPGRPKGAAWEACPGTLGGLSVQLGRPRRPGKPGASSCSLAGTSGRLGEAESASPVARNDVLGAWRSRVCVRGHSE